MPNESLSPCTTSVGTSTASSSSRRLFSGRPGGCTGKARQSTATAPASAAVRQATRAPMRTAAGDQREPGELAGAEVLDHGDPGCVELPRRGGSAPAGDAVGLLDERDADGMRVGDLGGLLQIRRAHLPIGAVAEDERGDRVAARGMQVHSGGAVGGVDVHSAIMAPAMIRRRPGGLSRKRTKEE